VDWRYAFERQWLFYKLWGRLTYDPSTPDAVFVEEFRRRYGHSVDNLLQAFELASLTPLPLICPLLSGLIFILEMAMKEEWNGKEAQVGGDHRQAA